MSGSSSTSKMRSLPSSAMSDLDTFCTRRRCGIRLTRCVSSRESPHGRALRILIVDDVPEIRDIVSMMLEGDERFRVVGQAADGEEAIAIAEREQPDVVLLDIEMPRMDGWQTLPRLR